MKVELTATQPDTASLFPSSQSSPAGKSRGSIERIGIPIFILAFYGVVRFGLTQWLDSFGEYASYIFETAFVSLVGFYYRDRLKLSLNLSKELLGGFAPAVLLGGISFLCTKPLGLIVPFDLRSNETILFLLLIGPILEEMIFRMALWESVVDLTRSISPYAILPVSVLIFSYAHFHAYWFVPEQIRPFVIYQALYVMPLAAYSGYRKFRTGSISPAILVHVGFNAGFFAASFF